MAGAIIFTSFQIAEFACKALLAEAEAVVALTVTGTIAGARFFVAGRSSPALVTDYSQIREDFSMENKSFSAVGVLPAFITETSSINASSVTVTIVEAGFFLTVFPSEACFTDTQTA